MKTLCFVLGAFICSAMLCNNLYASGKSGLGHSPYGEYVELHEGQHAVGDEENEKYARERLVKLLEEIFSNMLNEDRDNIDVSTAGLQGSMGDGAGEFMQEAVEYFERLLETPLNINSCSRRELEEFMFLSDFQIESILDYREKSGDILSALQLQLLHGFDTESVQIMLPFLCFAPYSEKPAFKRLSSQIFLKTNYRIEKDTMYSPVTAEQLEQKPNSRYLGSPVYLQMKYRAMIGNSVQAGFTLESDAGERFFLSNSPPVDFFSFHVALKSVGKVNAIVLGDYSARFGQGLVMWNSFSLHGASAPMGFYKRGSAIVPYTSLAESGFYRGAAASLSFRKLNVNTMLSFNRLDANIADNEYKSIIETGLHNTFTTVENRRTLAEIVAGANISYMFDKLKLGVSFAAYGYDKSNGRVIREYNKYQMYDGVWGNFSMDFYAIVRRIKLFGEIAADFGGSMAAIGGAVFNITEKLEAGVLLRSYSKSYIASHAGAYSTISSVANQRGVAINCVYPFDKLYRGVFGFEYSYYPWLRYNIDSPSSMTKAYIVGEYNGAKMAASVRISYGYTSHNATNRIYAKVQASMPLTAWLEAKIHLSAVESSAKKAAEADLGWQAGVNIRCRSINERVSFQTGGSFFDCGVWSSRLYVYQADMPYTYNSRLLYGNGCCIYALLKLRLLKGMDVYCKGETIQYTTDGKEPASYIKFALNFSLS